MNFAFERHLRTKDLEWFSIIDVNKNLHVHILFNNKDRSQDFSEDTELKRLRDIDSDLGDEYMKVHIFTSNMESFKNNEEEIHRFIDGLLHNVLCTWWIFLHEVKDSNKAAEEYLLKWGINDKDLAVVGNSIYNNLNQD